MWEWLSKLDCSGEGGDPNFSCSNFWVRLRRVGGEALELGVLGGFTMG